MVHQFYFKDACVYVPNVKKMEIEYTVFPGKKTKCIEIRGDESMYGTALKLIGARRQVAQKNWTLPPTQEETLRELIRGLGKNPDDVRKVDHSTRARGGARTRTQAPSAKTDSPSESLEEDIQLLSMDSEDSLSEKQDESSSRSDEEDSDDEESSESHDESEQEDDSSSISEEESISHSRFASELSKASRPVNSPLSRRSRILSSSRPVESKVSQVSKVSNVSKASVPTSNVSTVTKPSKVSKVSKEVVSEIPKASNVSKASVPSVVSTASNASTATKTLKDSVVSGASNGSKISRPVEQETYTSNVSKASKASKAQSKHSMASVASTSSKPSNVSVVSKPSKASKASRDAEASHTHESEYTFRYNHDKYKYYRSLGRRHLETIEDESTSFDESSDGFPTPSPPKKGKYTESEVRAMEKRLRELEHRVK